MSTWSFWSSMNVELGYALRLFLLTLRTHRFSTNSYMTVSYLIDSNTHEYAINNWFNYWNVLSICVLVTYYDWYNGNISLWRTPPMVSISWYVAHEKKCDAYCHAVNELHKWACMYMYPCYCTAFDIILTLLDWWGRVFITWLCHTTSYVSLSCICTCLVCVQVSRCILIIDKHYTYHRDLHFKLHRIDVCLLYGNACLFSLISGMQWDMHMSIFGCRGLGMW